MRSRASGTRLLLAAWLAVLGLGSAAPVEAAAGAFDPGFGASGVVQTDVTEWDVAADLVVQPDGKAITVAANGGMLLRHRVDGTLDPAFGVGGIVRSTTQAGFSGAVLQPDGRIVVVGVDESRQDVAVSRYLPSGALDGSFGAGGVVRTDFGANDGAGAVAVQPDGKLVVAGASGNAVALARYLPNGTLDPGFGSGGGGKTTTTFGSPDTPTGATSVGILSTGAVIVGGRALPIGEPLSMVLARYTPAGVLDVTYGAGGTVAPSEERLANLTSLVVQPGDRVVVAGTRSEAGSHQVIARYLADGSLDVSFGTGGSTQMPLGGFSSASDLAADGIGRLLTVSRVVWSDSFSHLTVSRFSPDGLADGGFGCAGATQIELAAAQGGIPAAIGVGPNGRILAGGTAYTIGPPDPFGQPDFVLVRLLPDGPEGAGYWITRADGGMSQFGSAGGCGSLRGQPVGGLIIGHAARPSGDGYWFAARFGSVAAWGDAPFLGDAAGLPLNRPIVGMASTPSGGGYWLVAADGGIFAYGDARFFGSTGGIRLNQQIVGMASTPSGAGYWLVAADGGIFAYGDAGFFGSTGGIRLNQQIVGMASTPSGAGYWLVAADGGIFAYGDAGFFGSTGGIRLNRPIVDMARTTSGAGYWLAGADGGIFAYGDAPFFGSTGGQPFASPAVALT